MIDILKLYRAFNIPHKTKGHKHCRPGWVQTRCPFCTGNPGYHLGFCFSQPGQFHGKFVCWRCGGKSIKRVLSKLLRLKSNEINKIIKDYGGKSNYGPAIDEQIKIRRKAFKYPAKTEDLLPHHARYLSRRNFNPDKLEKDWGLLSTGPIAPLVTNGKSLDYSHRIIIPIEWEERIVSFQGRDATDKHKLKYMACPQDREIIEHKSILYGKPSGDRCVLVEGVTDVWRLGPGALCCFGIKYRLAQIRLLAKFKEVFIFFDPEVQAREQAEKIQSELLFRGVKAVHLPMEKKNKLPLLDYDPGDMDQWDADKLMYDLGFKS